MFVGGSDADGAGNRTEQLRAWRLLFLKLPTACAPSAWPASGPLTATACSLHLELELGVVVRTRGAVAGCAPDVTTSDVRDECKKGLPGPATSFTAFSPISTFVPKEKIPGPHSLKLWPKVSGKVSREV